MGTGGGLNRSVPIEDLWTNDSHVRIALHKIQNLIEGTVRRVRIGIQNQYVTGRGSAYGSIHGSCKPNVSGVLRENDIMEVLDDAVNPILGAVVMHKNLSAKVPHLSMKGLYTTQ